MSGRLPTTRWSMVLAAGAGEGEDGRAALEALCASYWYPLYAFARRSGRDPDAAQDSVQAFFSRLLEKGSLGRADPGRGRFRSFILTAFQNQLRNEAAHARAQKRGGGRAIISLEQAEARYGHEPAVKDDGVEQAYLRDWGLAVLGSALASVRAHYEARGQGAQFDALKGCIAGGAAPRAAVAEQLGLSDAALRQAVHRLRERFRSALREEVADTLSDEGESLEDELKALRAVLG